MLLRLWLADAVVLIHFAFVVFVAVGGFIAWRWPRVLYVHIAAVTWGVGMLVIGYSCPLTILERELRGESAGGPGFIDRYVEGVVYPEEYTPHLRVLATVLVVISYVGLMRIRARRRVEATETLAPTGVVR